MSTYHHWHRLTREPHLRDVMIQAGRTLAGRFVPAGRYLSSFLGPASCFIDIMMNVGIIFYAARETQDAALRRVVMEHCLTTRRYLVREAGGDLLREVWVDAAGRLLKVSIPSQQLVAVRDDAPRSAAR